MRNLNDVELRFILAGQCTSGKNAVIVTRTGKRFPAKRFIDWRADAMEQLHPQLEQSGIKLPFTGPVSVEVVYTAKDRIRRDVPGIIDALWHLIEKIGIITDDTFLAGWGEQLIFINRGVIKDETGVEVIIRGNHESNMQVQVQQPTARRKKRSKRRASPRTKQRRAKNVVDGNTRSGE